MNFKFLAKRCKIREHEIQEGKNLGTRDPIYLVYSLAEHFVSEWSQRKFI